MPQMYPEADLHYACAYWETAVYLLYNLLGWSDPGKGLQWWYKEGKADLGDTRLQLLTQVRDSEGQLGLLGRAGLTLGQRETVRAPEHPPTTCRHVA